jgi:hypothetical protein
MKRWIAPATLAVVAALALVLSPARPSRAGNDAALRARVDTASKAFAIAKPSFASGRVTAENVCTWSLRWYQAEKALGSNKAAASDHLARVQAIETDVKAQFASGMASAFDTATVAYFRADAEALAASP